MNVAGGVRIEEPGADLAVALAIASAARGVPVREGLAAFGEIGLTGRLRQRPRPSGASTSARSSGSTTVVAPEGTPEREQPRVVPVESLRAAIRTSLRRRWPSSIARPGLGTSRERAGVAGGCRARPRLRIGTAVAVPLIPCEERAIM